MFNYYHLKRRLIVWYYTRFIYPYNYIDIRNTKRKIRQVQIGMIKDFKNFTMRIIESLNKSNEALTKFINIQNDFAKKIEYFVEHRN